MEGLNLNLDMLSTDDFQEDFTLDENTSLSQDLDADDNVVDNTTTDDNNIDNFNEDENPESVVEKDKGSDTADAKPSPGSDDDMSQVYSSFATHFRDAGILPSLNLDETKIKSAEDLGKAIKAEIDNATTEKQKAYEQAMENGEPQSEYVKYSKQKESLDKITDDSLESDDSAGLRFNIIAQNFVNKNFSKEDAIKYAKRSQDLAEDVEDAKKALLEIKDYNEQNYKASVKRKQDEDLANSSKIEEFVKSKEEIISGIKLTDTVKNNLIKQMTTAVARDVKGNPLTKYGKALVDDPVKTKAITEYMFLLTKGFTDFSKINTAIASKTTKSIDDVLRNNGGNFLNSNGTVNFNNKDNESTFSIDDKFDLDI